MCLSLIITFEELYDQNTHKEIRIQAVKFWYRQVVATDLSGFEVTWVVQNPCKDDTAGIKLHSVDNRKIVIVNGSKVQVWHLQDHNRWTILTQLQYQDLKVQEIHSSIKLRIHAENQKSQRCVALLHEHGNVTFWDQENFSFLHTVKLSQAASKVVFESSSRYLAALTQSGSVEVWSIYGKGESHLWNLSFKSVKDIVNNSSKENQFVITMNSNDDATEKPDSVLLFQYSRPQNLVMYWKAQLPFEKVVFCDNLTCSYLLIINKNMELQKIYFGVTKDDIKTIAVKRRASMELKVREGEKAKEIQRKADYSFIGKKPEQDPSLLTERKGIQSMQEIQMKRLDKVDRVLGDGEGGQGSFLGMGSLTYYFDKFANEMLSKPSKATNLIDLQEELFDYRDTQAFGGDIEMKGANDEGDLVEKIQTDLSTAFAGLFK